MSFEELDREIRQDIMTERWQRLRPAIIALVILIVSTVAGHQIWQYYQTQQQTAAATRYFVAQSALSEGNEASLEAITEIINDNNVGYQLMARFRLATYYIENNRIDEARAVLLSIHEQNDISDYMRSSALLQAAMLPPNDKDTELILTHLEGLTTADNPWRHIARYAEIGIQLAQNNTTSDQAAVRQKIDAMLADQTTPQTLREAILRVRGVL